MTSQLLFGSNVGLKCLYLNVLSIHQKCFWVAMCPFRSQMRMYIVEQLAKLDIGLRLKSKCRLFVWTLMVRDVCDMFVEGRNANF